MIHTPLVVFLWTTLLHQGKANSSFALKAHIPSFTTSDPHLAQRPQEATQQQQKFSDVVCECPGLGYFHVSYGFYLPLSSHTQLWPVFPVTQSSLGLWVFQSQMSFLSRNTSLALKKRHDRNGLRVLSSPYSLSL